VLIASAARPSARRFSMTAIFASIIRSALGISCSSWRKELNMIIGRLLLALPYGGRVRLGELSTGC
jgi:hypothetical protein